jgi:hypothetical protein
VVVGVVVDLSKELFLDNLVFVWLDNLVDNGCDELVRSPTGYSAA